MVRIFLFLCVALMGIPAITNAQSVPTALTGAHIIPIDGDEIPSGTLLIHKGKILDVGADGDVTLPQGTKRINMTGKTLMPGLICTHSHIGGWGGGDGSGPIQPETRILDAINVKSAGFKRALAGGLTTLNIMPGSGHLMSGQTLYVKLRSAQTIQDMFIINTDGKVAGGLKMANGTNSMGDGPYPGTRSKSAALVREKFIKAQEYRRKVKAAKGNPDKLPPRDLSLEILSEVLDGKRVVHHHTHRHDDIMTVLRLSQEFGFRVVLQHVSEGWKIADEIAKSKAPASIIIVDSPGGKLEAINLIWETGAALEKAGVPVAYHTDDWITDSRLFLRSPALGVRAGLSRKTALSSVTQTAAEMLDLGHRIGSFRKGKDADIAVLSGDPLSVYTQVLETWVEGEKVFDRTNESDRLHATGGLGASNDSELYLCCEEK